MLNILDTKIKLTPSEDALNLIAADGTVGYRSTITFAALLVCKIKLNPALSAHEKTLLQMNAKYPLKCVSLKTVSVPKGMLSLLLHYSCCHCICLCYRLNGSYKANPFNFQTLGLIYMVL